MSEQALPPGARFRITVPASSANLGSGFDTLGLALAHHDVLDVEVLPGDATNTRVDVVGEGAGRLPGNGRHLVARVAAQVLGELGRPVPALHIRCRNVIPHSRGLGSSAAAIVAGVAIGCTVAGFPMRESGNAARALHWAAEFEGHADNVAASLFGGLAVAWRETGTYRAVSVRPHGDVRPVAFVPEFLSATHTMRGLLPDAVPHGDAAFAAGRAALAVHAIGHDPRLLLAATEDRLHQEYRRPALARTMDLVDQLRAAGIPAAVSGAGPTVLAFLNGAEVPSHVDHGEFTALELPVDLSGVQVNVVS